MTVSLLGGEGSTVCFFPADLVLFAFSEPDLRHALDRFSAPYDQAGMKISRRNEVLRFSRNPSQCNLQIRSSALHLVEKFKYAGVQAMLFTNHQ